MLTEPTVSEIKHNHKIVTVLEIKINNISYIIIFNSLINRNRPRDQVFPESEREVWEIEDEGSLSMVEGTISDYAAREIVIFGLISKKRDPSCGLFLSFCPLSSLICHSRTQQNMFECHRTLSYLFLASGVFYAIIPTMYNIGYWFQEVSC